MTKTVYPGKVSGTVNVPPSKSIFQRYLIAALLADGTTVLENIPEGEDTLACLGAIRQLGAVVDEADTLHITGVNGKIRIPDHPVHCGESGFALRALGSVASLAEGEITLTGSGTLVSRPVDFFDTILPLLGVSCKTTNGFSPVMVKGPVRFRDIAVDGSQSSQFLSGLLFIYPFAGREHTIEVANLRSRMYTDLTIEVLKKFGVSVENDSYRRFTIPGNQQYRACKAKVEGDWSAAAFLLVAGALAGEVTIGNLRKDSSQPDRTILNVLKDSGACVEWSGDNITVKKDFLKAFEFDATGCPDLFPPLVALASGCEGTSVITGVERLVHKESNRGVTLTDEFSKLRPEMISMSGNRMMVKGNTGLMGCETDSHLDHRIAMALAVAALRAEDKITISGSEAVGKSYPDFFSDLERLKTI